MRCAIRRLSPRPEQRPFPDPGPGGERSPRRSRPADVVTRNEWRLRVEIPASPWPTEGLVLASNLPSAPRRGFGEGGAVHGPASKRYPAVNHRFAACPRATRLVEALQGLGWSERGVMGAFRSAKVAAPSE